MVRITNGMVTTVVSLGAYNSIFKDMGYRVLDSANKRKTETSAEQSPMSEDEKFAIEIVEKPLSEWNKEEVKRFAKIKGIDISETKGVTEAKELIKKFLEAEN